VVAKGHFILRSYAKPPITAGRYQLHATQPSSGVEVEAHDGQVYVSSPRYVMPPDQILSTYPPAMSEGDVGGRLPQIVLKRRTLPWERRPDPARPRDEVPPIPWLALVVIAEGEGSVSPEPRPVAECITLGAPPLPDPTDADSATGYYLSVTQTVVDKVFPTIEDLPLLVHVREVDISDTELGAGDDDGFLAVVLANRLPIAVPQPDGQGGTISKPVKYLACLVNLEGQLGALPTTQVTDDVLVLTEAVQDVRLLTYQSAAHADHVVMGTGVANLATKAPAGPLAAGATLQARAVAPAAPSTAAGTWTAAAAAPVAQPAATRGTDAIRLEMAGGFAVDFEWFVTEKTYRFPVLAHWSFTSVNEGDFRSVAQALDVGLIGTQFGTVLDSTGEHANEPDPADPPRPTGPEVAATGHVALPQTTRRGDPGSAWFRGPLTPHPTERDPVSTPPTHISDELRAVTPDGREDVSHAAAFEIGRLLALSQPSLVSALTRWRGEQFGAARAAAVGELLSKQTVFELGDALRGTLGRALGLELLVRGGVAAGDVVGPSRPLADPGAPIELTGSLDQVVATGLGLDLGALQQAAGTMGMAHAVAATPPVVAEFDGPDGAATTTLHGALDTELSRIAATATPTRRVPKGRRAAVEMPDALDALIDGAGGAAFDVAADVDAEEDL
jgi:hypothetical protein